MKKYGLAIVLCYVMVATSSLYSREDGPPPEDKQSDRTHCPVSSGATKDYIEKEVEKPNNK